MSADSGPAPDRPWTQHYTAGVRPEMEVPDEPVTAPLQRAAQRWPDRRRTLSLLVFKIELFAFFVAAAAPSPLLVPYRHEFGFGPAMVTIIFAIYAVALLIALLVAGGLSDHVGRRPVLIGTLALEALGMAVFWSALDTDWLLAGRAVQGVATGIAVGALNAAILEAAPSGSRVGALINGFAPLSGLAVGGLATGWLIRQVADPVTVTFAFLTLFFAVVALVSLGLPETSPRRPGALTSLVPRISVPRTARRTFLSLVPSLSALWATGGLYLSLVPLAMKDVFGVESALAGGFAIGLLNASGAVAPLLLRRLLPSLTTVIGSSALVLGAAGVALSTALTSTPVFFVATAVAGSGFGMVFSAGPRQVMELVPGDQRAATFASIYVVSYLTFSVPAVAAGALVGPLGLDHVLLGYAVVVLVSSAIGLATSMSERRRTRDGADAAGTVAPHVAEV
ncbi:MFS transporter [Nocardioides sp. DS6]|uniref:MFS transporter n=1 Tax=Nocardioides eburneus TaxID=3231482 RepID=A0ABV3T1I8_9ACTN